MRKRALMIAAVTLVAFAGVATAASATTIEYTSGGTVASGSAISGSLKSGTVAHLEGGSAGDIDCSASAFGGTLGTNPFTPSVTGSLTSLTFSSCTDTIPFVTVSSVTTNVGTGVNAKTATATWVAPGTNSTFAIAGVEVTVTFSSGSTCIYQPTGATATAKHNSNTTPKNNEYHFDDVPVTKIGGTFGFCPTNGVTWDALYVATSGGTGITIQD